MARPLIFKKSPIVIVGSFVALQFATAGLYMLAASLAYYAQIWRSLPILRDFDFSIAQGVFLFMGEIVLILYMFLSWYRQTVRFTDEHVIYDQGLLMRSHTVIPFLKIATVTFRQSILGRLTHYGSIDVRDAQGSLLVRLDSMPEPYDFVQEVLQRISSHPRESLVAPSDLVAIAEHEQLERKSTFRWDMRSKTINKALEKATMKTVAAFMNSRGGQILLGVGDAGEAVGLEADYATLPRGDADGFQNHFNNTLAAMIGPSWHSYVRLEPFTHEGKECMLVSVSPSQRPAYLRDQDREEFFIRTGNGSTALRISEVNAYIASRFGVKS